MRREWIEIRSKNWYRLYLGSPSMRREWIEIAHSAAQNEQAMSPSMRREWIEIELKSELQQANRVSLHAEGVD